MQTDLYICTRVRACKWKGNDEEMALIPMRGLTGGKHRVCPNCHNREFFIRHQCSYDGCTEVSTRYEVSVSGWSRRRTSREFCEPHALDLITQDSYPFDLKLHKY